MKIFEIKEMFVVNVTENFKATVCWYIVHRQIEAWFVNAPWGNY